MKYPKFMTTGIASKANKYSSVALGKYALFWSKVLVDEGSD
jgi:hypothetical protein